MKSDSDKNDGFDFEKSEEQKPTEEIEQEDPLIEFLKVRKKLFFPNVN